MRCNAVKFKLQEALVRLYSMLNEFSKAVKLSLTTNMPGEAQKLANRSPSKLDGVWSQSSADSRADLHELDIETEQ